MTDKVGIFEHCINSSVNQFEGYCVDDNARALSVCLKLNGKVKKTAQQLIPIYFSFLKRASDKKGFHQDLNSDLRWKDDPKVEEGYGRAMTALAETIVLSEKEEQKSTAELIFDQQSTLIPTIKYPKVIAHVIIALSIRIELMKSPHLINQLIELSDKLVKDYHNHSSKDWKWYEDLITYDNSRLALALFCAYQVTNKKNYLEIGKESLDFLIEKTYNNSQKVFSFIGNKGWYQRGKKPAVFDQQPIEAGSMVEACVKLYQIIKETKYQQLANTAFSWYSGQNILCLSLIDNLSGGIYDGLEIGSVNKNEGAESILSYIAAYLALETTKK